MSEKKESPLVFQFVRGQNEVDEKPIVLEYKSGRKKKKKSAVDTDEKKGPKYSSGLKDIQEAEGGLLKIARKASRSVTKALDTYDKERSKSAEEKKDGAIEDFPHNAAKAVSEAMKEASDLPLDIVVTLSTNNLRKQLRRNQKRTARTLKTFRI